MISYLYDLQNSVLEMKILKFILKLLIEIILED